MSAIRGNTLFNRTKKRSGQRQENLGLCEAMGQLLSQYSRHMKTSFPFFKRDFYIYKHTHTYINVYVHTHNIQEERDIQTVLS